MNVETFFVNHSILNEFQELFLEHFTGYYINEKGENDSCVIIVHVSGLFIFRDEKTLQMTIPINDIVEINVTNDLVILSLTNSVVNLRTDQNYSLAALIRDLTHLLFEHVSRCLIFNIDCDECDVEYNVPSDSLLADRFLSISLHQIDSFDQELLRETYQILSSFHGSFSITQDLIANPFISSICEALSFDLDIEVLELSGFAFSCFVPFFEVIIMNNTSICELVFTNITFSGPLQSCSSLFCKGHRFRPRNLHYNHCDFSSPQSQFFFESFLRFKGKIKFVEFNSCTLTRQSLDNVFQCLLLSDCFHYLESICMRRIYKNSTTLPLLILQFINSTFIYEHRCLRFVGLSDCEVDINEFLPMFLLSDCGVMGIDLSGNSFLSPMTLKQVPNLYNIENLNISRCKCKADSIISIMKIIKRINVRPFLLSCCRLDMEKTEWNKLYSELPSIVISPLRGFAFDGNELNKDNISQFIRFLENQPNLKSLSLSNCFLTEDFINVTPILTGFLTSKPLEILSIRIDQNVQLPSMSQLMLQSVLHNSSIKYIDFIGQCICENLLLFLSKNLPINLKALMINNTSVPSFDKLCKIYQSFLSFDSLEFVLLPIECLTRLSIGSPGNLPDLEKIMNQYHQYYGYMSIERNVFEWHEHFFSGKLVQYNSIAIKPSNSQVLSEPISENLLKLGHFEQNLVNTCQLMKGRDPITYSEKRILNENDIFNLIESLEIV